MYIIYGIIIGSLSLIPGISSGTILVIINKYDEITQKINNIFKNKKNIKDILLLLIGIIISIITLSKIINYFIKNHYNSIMIFFIGLIIITTTKNKFKLKPLYFFIGFISILLLNTFKINTPTITDTYSFSFLIYFSLMGFIDGFATIIPGISGSMIMMILGPYYLLNNFLSKIIIIPILFYYLGDFLGIITGSKVYHIIKKINQNKTTSLITGLILSSSFIMYPSNITYSFNNILLYTIIILISFIITTIISS